MAKIRRAQAQREPEGRRKAKTVDRGAAAGSVPAPAEPAMLVMDGNRPHETTLHDTTLEDFGLDMLRVIQPHHP